jgi:hypothetical protein
MTLTTHAIIGAAIASSIPSHPVLGFALGFGSHFLLDAIPHWDYSRDSVKENTENPMKSEMTFNKDFVIDLFKMGADFLLGLTVVFFIFVYPNFNIPLILSGAIFWGVVGGLLPDFLQFVYFIWKHEPMVSLQKFHVLWAHAKISLDDRPALGITLQAILIIIVVMISKLFF